MPLGPDVHYLADVIRRERKAIDSDFWDAMTTEDVLKASNRETMLEHLECLYEQGEEFYTDF